MGRWVRRGASLALAVVVVLLAAAGAEARPARCNGEVALCDRTLDRVVLPAAHNAMSASSLGWQLPNQQGGLPEQLGQGIRGFLVDTHLGHREPDGSVRNDAVRTPASELFLCHVLCQLGATPLADALNGVRAWLRLHPRNVIVIVNEDAVPPEDFAAAMRRSRLLRHVYRGPTGPWPTLGEMIARRRQVVVLAERDSGTVPWYHEACAGTLQETPYTWARPAELTDPANWPATCRPNRGGTTGSLFLMNHWSPPFAPDPAVSALVNAPDVVVGRALACRAVRGRLPTLVAADMVGSGGLVEGVRRLNALPAP